MLRVLRDVKDTLFGSKIDSLFAYMYLALYEACI